MVTKDETLQENEQSDYKKGFNDGYILSQHSPELASKIRFNEEESESLDYVSGFVEGQLQRNHEMSLFQEYEAEEKRLEEERLREIQLARNKGKDKSNDRER